MILRLLANIFKQGTQGISRNRSMSLVSILSISIVLMILGMVLILVLSINKVISDTNATVDQINVFIDPQYSEEQIQTLTKDIQNLNGIKEIRFKSRDQYLRELKESWGENAHLLDSYDENNPFYDSIVLRVSDINLAKEINSNISKMDGVIKTNFFADEIEQMLNISKYIKIGGLAIVVFLTFVSIFLISNTIKLAVNSRRMEINIMKWVGATNGYIKGPFFIEGVILGLIASVIASTIMYFLYNYIFVQAKRSLSTLISEALVQPSQLYGDMAIIFLTLGVGIGALGSLISLKKFLKV